MVGRLLAIFFREPLLVQVVPFFGHWPLIDSTVIVHNAILTREMRFEEQARAGFWSALISGLSGLIYAFIQPTVWALVFLADWEVELCNVFVELQSLCAKK